MAFCDTSLTSRHTFYGLVIDVTSMSSTSVSPNVLGAPQTVYVFAPSQLSANQEHQIPATGWLGAERKQKRGLSGVPRGLALSLAYHIVSVATCSADYQYGIEEICLAKFKLDMEALDRRHWCNWDDTVESYGQLTNCTFVIAMNMDCFWPNHLVNDFFIRIHKHYFQNCALSGRLLQDPPSRILGPFIVVPVLITLLMTALVVWRSKRSEGIM